MEIGLVSDAGTGRSTGGRAPREVRFRREAAAVTGVDLGATSIEMAVTDLTGEPLATYEEDWDIARGPEETLDRVETLVEQIVADSPVSPTNIVGLGVGLPGPVEFASGRTISPPIMPGWSNFPVRDRLAGRFGVHVVVDNDVNTMAIGEQRLGLARGVDNFVFVKVGTGIGPASSRTGCCTGEQTVPPATSGTSPSRVAPRSCAGAAGAGAWRPTPAAAHWPGRPRRRPKPGRARTWPGCSRPRTGRSRPRTSPPERAPATKPAFSSSARRPGGWGRPCRAA